MSDSRPNLLRIAGCLLAALFCTTNVQAQAIGSGLLGSPPQERPAARQRMRRQAPQDYVPRHERMGNNGPRASFASQSIGRMHSVEFENEGLAPVPMEGETIIEDYSGDYAGGGDCQCGVEDCNGCCSGIWGLIGGARRRGEYYSGFSSFSSPVNRGGAGSFGYEGGFNLGSPLLGGLYGLGWQAGVGGTLTNFNGADFTRDDRHQFFATGGFFRRVDWGLQGGVVIDYLKDEWYANADFTQVRGELGWVVPEGREYGFMFAAGDEGDLVTGTLQNGTALPTDIEENWRVNDLYALYFRRTFCNNAHGRIFGGWSGDSDGLLGADLLLPLDDSWALRTGFTYLIPEEGPLDGGHEEEAWNLSILLVWYPHCTARCGQDYYRPLFNVANNSTMILDR